MRWPLTTKSGKAAAGHGVTACVSGSTAIRQEARQHKDHAHQLAVRLGSLQAQHDSTQPSAGSAWSCRPSACTRSASSSTLNLEEGAAPLEELRMKLEEQLDKRMAVEDELKLARLALEDADRDLRDAEKRRTQAEQQAQLLRGQLEQQRMDWQSLSSTPQSAAGAAAGRQLRPAWGARQLAGRGQ